MGQAIHTKINVQTVVAALARRGVQVTKDATVTQLCKAVSRVTGKPCTNDPETRWVFLKEFCNGPQSVSMPKVPFKEMKPGRLKHVIEEMNRRELLTQGKSVVEILDMGFGDE